MFHSYMGKCVDIAAYLPIESLDSLVPCQEDADNLQPLGHSVQDVDCDIEADFLRHDMARQVRQFVASLPPRLGDIAHRFYWLDQPQAQIADELSITPSAVSQAMRRISDLGRAYFEQQYN